ncbi:MAG: choice-of-anchor tandem repeat NxxGxxAF-containing protein [Terriglobia bacterium]
MRPQSAFTAVKCLLAVLILLLGSRAASAQSNTRLLLSSGWGVPAHQGFAFGPFRGLAMNEAREVVFLSSLRGAKSDLAAVVRSSGVTFSVVAFQGLRAPVPKAVYESFSAPSINRLGQIAFTAGLKDDVPPSAVIRVEGDSALAVVSSGNAVPDKPDATFQEFSPPVLTSAGNIVFGARLGGKQPGSGLFLWTPKGLKSVALPPEVTLKPSDLLVPAFASHDEAVFVLRGAPTEAVTEQIFRAVANQSYQDLRPQPGESEAAEILPARAGEPPVKLLFVLAEGEEVRTAVLAGDATAAVKAKRSEKSPPLILGRIQAQTAGPSGNVIFAAAPAEQPTDLALFCYCQGELRRLTSPEEFLPVTGPTQGKPILSLSGDGQHTMAFIAPAEAASDATAIYVTSIP